MLHSKCPCWYIRFSYGTMQFSTTNCGSYNPLACRLAYSTLWFPPRRWDSNFSSLPGRKPRRPQHKWDDILRTFPNQDCSRYCTLACRRACPCAIASAHFSHVNLGNVVAGELFVHMSYGRPWSLSRKEVKDIHHSIGHTITRHEVSVKTP